MMYYYFYQELEKSEALAEEAKKKSRNQVKNAPAAKVSKPAPKNPRKNNKKANNAEAAAESRETSSSFVFEMGKPRLVKSFLLKISHSHYFIFETLVRL